MQAHAGRMAMLSTMFSAGSYITDGLIAMWDGIENAGYGSHDPAPMRWMDLTGNGHDFTVQPGGTPLVFDKDHFYGNGLSAPYALLENQIAATTQVEIVLKMDWLDASAVYETPICFSSNGFRIAAPTSSAEVVNRGFSLMGGYFASSIYSTLHMTKPTSYSFQAGKAGSPYNQNSPYSVLATYCNGLYIGANRSQVGFTNTIPSLGPTSYRDKPFKGSIYSVRLYSRMLTPEEISANYAVDKARFNLKASEALEETI